MPPYFSVSFVCDKNCITQNTVQNFYQNLIECGCTFKSGYWGFENNTLPQIIEWNQKKLEQNFQLGYTEDHTYDYKQVQFDFHDFSEVRVFIFNMEEKNTFSFELIIPEDDFIRYEYQEEKGKHKIIYLEEKLLLIKDLMEKMWKKSENPFWSVQTGWECSDTATSVEDMQKGIEPLIQPYAIIPSELFHNEWHFPFYKISNNGIMFTDDVTKWKY